jgi:hypothetical protein
MGVLAFAGELGCNREDTYIRIVDHDKNEDRQHSYHSEDVHSEKEVSTLTTTIY